VDGVERDWLGQRCARDGVVDCFHLCKHGTRSWFGLARVCRVQFGCGHLLKSLHCIRDRGCRASTTLRCTLNVMEVCAWHGASACVHAWERGCRSRHPRRASGLSGLRLEGWPMGGGDIAIYMLNVTYCKISVASSASIYISEFL
jgi:hypothetical protein